MINLLFLVIITIMLVPIAIFNSKVLNIGTPSIPIIIFEVTYLISAIWASIWLTGTIITLVVGL